MKTALVAIIVFAAILLPCLVIRCAGRNESRRLCTGRAWKTVAR